MTSRRRILSALSGLLGAALLGAGPGRAETPFITVASTTSTEQSGLFAHLLPAFTKATGIEVRVVAVGTGQALKIGERGDADVLLVHDQAAELAFVAAGWDIGRHDLMYNDFVVVGPRSDPAGVAGGRDVVAALKAVASAKATFVTRGDDSGTNAAERRFWRDAGLDPKAASAGAGWYKDIGGGMGAALNACAAMDAYTLSDRGTWLSFVNRRDLVILVEGDQRLFNQYGVMLVNPARHPSVKAALGQTFIDWLISHPPGSRWSRATGSTDSNCSSRTWTGRGCEGAPAGRGGGGCDGGWGDGRRDAGSARAGGHRPAARRGQLAPSPDLSGAIGASRYHLLAVFDGTIGILASTPLTVEHEVVLTRPAVLPVMDVSAGGCPAFT